ncbi:hypothetical protein NHJ13051_009638 [Beauveria bassiana]
MAHNLGNLTALNEEGSSQTPVPSEFQAFAAANNGEISDKEIASRAVADSQIVPSIWFVNFPEPEAWKNKDVLSKYMENIEDYRCWASLVWWRTVYTNKAVPQGSSLDDVAFRNAYCARVATKHMQTTPWLAMSSNNNATRQIHCETTEFHETLITTVLAGFILPTPAMFSQLETILNSIRETTDISDKHMDNRTIICERYEYNALADTIKSYVRIISFTVTDSIKEVQKAKKTERKITCILEYNDYEAVFNQKLWASVSTNIEAAQKKDAEDFVNNQTVDCPP